MPFSTVAAPCDIPNSNAQRLPFLHILVSTCLLPLDFKEQGKGQHGWIGVAKEDEGGKKAGEGEPQRTMAVTRGETGSLQRGGSCDGP